MCATYNNDRKHLQQMTFKQRPDRCVQGKHIPTKSFLGGGNSGTKMLTGAAALCFEECHSNHGSRAEWVPGRMKGDEADAWWGRLCSFLWLQRRLNTYLKIFTSCVCVLAYMYVCLSRAMPTEARRGRWIHQNCSYRWL